jgi:hypothetical protein
LIHGYYYGYPDYDVIIRTYYMSVLTMMKWNFDRKEQRQWNMKSYLGYTWRYLPKLITVLTCNF